MNDEIMYTSRIISLRGDIDVDTTGDIIDKILYFNFLDSETPVGEREPVHLHIQSNGGCCADGYALADIIESSETPIYTYCDGYVESTAVDIYLSGSRRFVYPHSTFLIHATKTAIPTLQPIKNIYSSMDYIERINEFGKQTLREKTMFDEDMIENMYSSTDDYTFYAEDAINHGIATDMICK